MTALFDRYISTLPELDRRAAGIGIRPAPQSRAPRPRRFWRRARFTLAVTAFAITQAAVTVAVVLGPVWSW